MVSRWGFDLVSGYKHKEIPKGSKMTFEELRKGEYIMTEAQWLSVSVLGFRLDVRSLLHENTFIAHPFPGVHCRCPRNGGSHYPPPP
jgi:hypothetical protein